MWPLDGGMKESSLSPWLREESRLAQSRVFQTRSFTEASHGQQIFAPNRYSIFKGSDLKLSRPLRTRFFAYHITLAS